MTELRLVCIDENNVETWYEINKKDNHDVFVRCIKIGPKPLEESEDPELVKAMMEEIPE